MDENENNNIIDGQLLDDTIEIIENYLFGKGDNCGEKLFIDFAKENKKYFLNSGIGKSTENDFKFTELFEKFQVIYEKKLEELINSKGITSEQFYNALSKRCVSWISSSTGRSMQPDIFFGTSTAFSFRFSQSSELSPSLKKTLLSSSISTS